MAYPTDLRVEAALAGRDINDFLTYDPATGEFYWKPRDFSLFRLRRACLTWNLNFAGKRAFTYLNKDGYRVGSLFKVGVRAHRMAWRLFHGVWPEGFIDHINGDGTDNRICNLRVATHIENMHNARRGSRSRTSAFKGVHKYKRRWRAHLSSQGQKILLGSFDTELSAALAYDAAARVHHGQFACLNFPEEGEQSAHRGEDL